LIARLDESNSAFLDYHVLPRIEGRTRFRLRLKDSWLKQGIRLHDLSELHRAVEQIAHRARGPRPKLP
jgi:hypothetical protein